MDKIGSQAESESQRSEGSVSEDNDRLPIEEFKETIIEMVREQLFCIITGETGSGKSTQIAQFLLDGIRSPFQELAEADVVAQSSQQAVTQLKRSSAARPRLFRVVVTQPRRVATIQMAKRVSFERSCRLGEQVGYSIRFDDKTDAALTQIKYATDGVMVRECLQDPDLSKYSVVVLDEAHERSLNTDILFALVKQAVLRRRGTLRLVVTSATLKTEQLAAYYFDCPVLSVSGRCFPVTIMFKESSRDKKMENAVGAAIRIHLHEPAGDILVFLTGFEECEQAVKTCYSKLQEMVDEGKEVPPMMLAALYGAQSAEQQQNAFIKTPEGCRKIIFATNIAETSLTVDNVGYVIDCGFVKQNQYSAETGMESLVTVPISKVQAIQRSGRAGRTREGKCLRLYTQDFYRQMMPASTLPEIKRVNLTQTVLVLKSMGIRDVLNFDFLDKPDEKCLRRDLKQLYLLDAIDDNGELRKLGDELAKLPLDPTYGKALLASKMVSRGCADDMTNLLSMLSTESIWLGISRSDENRLAIQQATKDRFSDKRSDHQSLVDIYGTWEAKYHSQGASQWAFQNGLQHRALLMARSISSQLRQQLDQVSVSRISKYFRNIEDEMGRRRRQKSALGRSDQLRFALSQGFYMQTCRWLQQSGTSEDRSIYLSIAEGCFVSVHRQSNLKSQAHEYVVYTQFTGMAQQASTQSVSRSNQSQQMGFMRMVSLIDVDWVAPLLPKLRDPVDIERLSGRMPTRSKEETKEETLTAKQLLLGKRKAQISTDQLEAETVATEQPTVARIETKEEKLARLKQNFQKRQKRQ